MQHQQTKQIAKHLNVAVIATAIKLHSIKKAVEKVSEFRFLAKEDVRWYFD